MIDTEAQRIMMVDTQVRPSDVTKFPIIDAMLAVERADFVPQDARLTAYSDAPVALGGGRAMLEPRTLAKILDDLDIQPTELVLDLGVGLGYSAAVIARMAEAVVALEEDPDLARDAEVQLASASADNVAVVSGPLSEGAAQHGPYDVIVVQGAIEVLPEGIGAQLKPGGRIAAIFMDGPLGVARVGLKGQADIVWRDAFNATANILPGFHKERAFQL